MWSNKEAAACAKSQGQTHLNANSNIRSLRRICSLTTTYKWNHLPLYSQNSSVVLLQCNSCKLGNTLKPWSVKGAMLNKLYLLPMQLDCTLYEHCNYLNDLSVSLPKHWSRKANKLWWKEALLYFAESCWLVMSWLPGLFFQARSRIGKPHLKWFGFRTIDNRIHWLHS